MPSARPPRSIRTLVRHLEKSGFTLEDEVPGEQYGPRLLLQSPQSEIWIVWDRGWEITVGGPGMNPQPLNIWKACLEGTRVRVGTEGVEWECEYLKRHLGAIETALAPDEIATTKARLEQKQQEARARVLGGIPVAPWSLDAEPRPGVRVHFGVRRQDDSLMIAPDIRIENNSEASFRIRAEDFRVSFNGRRAKMHVLAILSKNVAVGTTWTHEDGSAWHWANVWSLRTIKLRYVSSDPSSKGFKLGREWLVAGNPTEGLQ